MIVAMSAVVAMQAASASLAQEQVRELSEARAALDKTGFAGTVLVFDVSGNTYAAAHAESADHRLIPASTFKIFNSLVALETGVIADEHSIIEWDGVVRERSELNRDLDLATAFRLSAVPHYQELARRIGVERMQHFIDAVGYGNRDISGGIDRFWLDGGLRISPREQVDFLVRLYRGELPFSAEAMATVKEIMVDERTTEYVLRAKAGWALLGEGRNVGWWVGWVESGAAGVNVFATALRATAPGASFGPAREAITRSVLTQLGVLDSDE